MVNPKNSNDEIVACEVCMKEIPRSAAKVEEANDYVAYFCGLDCYDKWKSDNNKNKSGKNIKIDKT